jgi:hypothetical protein
MRGRHFLLVLPVFGTMGCFGSSSGGAPSATFDGGILDATFDAGEGEDASMDASGEAAPQDAGVDAPHDAPTSPEAAVEAGAGGLGVVVSNASGPEPNVVVVLQDATGAVVTTSTTDAAGRFAAPTITSGSQITFLFGTQAAASILTIQGLQPGDVIPVFDPNEAGSYPATIQSLPPNPPAMTESYNASAGPCAFTTFGAAPGGTANIVANPAGAGVGSSSCVSGNTFPVLVVADGPNGALGYASQAGNQLVTDGGTIGVTVGGTWSTDVTPTTLGAANWPDASVFYGGELAVGQVAGGVLLPSANIDTQGTGPTGPLNATIYPGYGDVQAEAYVYGLSLSITDIAIRAAADAGVSTIDMSQLLPLIDTASIDTTNPARPSVSYASEAGSLAGADATIVMLSWNGIEDGGVIVQSTWTIVAPATATSISVPALPPASAGWGPFADVSYATPLVAVLDASFISSYAQVRTNVSAVSPTATLLNGYPHSALLPPLPVDGTLRLTAYTTNGD